MRVKIAAAVGAVALVGAGAVATVAADDPAVATCTDDPRVQAVETGSRITIVCTVPRPAPVTVTQTVTATPEPSPTVEPTVEPVPTATSTPTPSPTATPTTEPTGWPDASNTGVPDGVALRASGSVTVTQAGAVVDGLDITGSLTINANNVTVKNTRVRSTAFWPVTIKTGVTGVVLQDIEVDGMGKTAGASGIVGPATVVRADIRGVENGWVPGNGSVLRGSWIHDLSSAGSPHYDGIQIDGGVSNITATGNHVDLTNHGQTAAVMVDNYFGAATGIAIDGNLLRGGGYTVYADGNFNSNRVQVTYSNNRLTKGGYGYALVRNSTVTWAGNVDHSTGRTVTP